MLLHGAVMQVWQSWSSGTGMLEDVPEGVSVFIADNRAVPPEQVTIVQPVAAAITGPQLPVATSKTKALSKPVRPEHVSQAIRPNIKVPVPNVPVRDRIQAPMPSANESTPLKPQAPPVKLPTSPPSVIEPGYDMGSPQNPEPAYPFVARKFSWQGLVQIVVDVSASGQPQQVQVLHSSGHSVLDQAALETIRDKWLFQPARQDGESVPSKVIVPVQFELRK